MSSSERLLDTRFAKRLVLVNGLVPAALLGWDAWHDRLGVNDVNFAIRTTGLVGLVLLLLSLAITPLRELFGWNLLVAVRRNLGLLGFSYIATHFAIFFLFDREGSVSDTIAEIVERRYLWVGAFALLAMIPLVVTSTDGMVRRLGARWKVLHRLAYAVGIGGVLHYYMLVKSDVRQPLAFAGVLGVLLGYRVVSHYVGLRRAVHIARQETALARARTTKKRKYWTGELRIARIFDETHDVKTFRLVSPDGGPLPFEAVAGQYLNLALTLGHRRLHRSYTIASPPTRSAYCEISVKRVADGDASKHLHDTWREGDRIKVSAPAGRFVFVGDEADEVLLIAGGIGITPMMSIVRSLTDRGWRGRIRLLISVREVRDVVYRDELAALAARFDDLQVRVHVTRDPDTAWDGARGPITREAIAAFVPEPVRGPVLLCGPDPMMTAMREILLGMGVPDDHVHQEAFVSPSTVVPTPGLATTVVTEPLLPEGVAASLVFGRSGRSVELPWEQTVLEAAEEAGVSIPFECRSGICGQCKTRLVSGAVTMEVQDALTAADRASGRILACQARAARVDLEIDA